MNVVRIFADGDYVFGHTEYDFSTRRIGFEVFRFEDGFAVEHWDNIQPRLGPNPSGRTMVDGTTDAVDLDKTEQNRLFVNRFVDEVLIDRHLDRLDAFVDDEFVEHNPALNDGRSALRAHLESSDQNRLQIEYKTLHRTLAEGSFVLAVCEGDRGGVHTSFYDLFRLSDGRVVEHWDTTEKVPPISEWKNHNGKF